ncbi:MAG: bifunctional phosphoglucose/phosphomannose isomerase, partial [candidate division WOR-3 bacterium]
MYELIYSLPEEIETAIEISLLLKVDKRKIENLVICGMGGSGIGGELFYGIYGAKIDLPIHINRDYHLPPYVNNKTLVILVSYSGNTEETLANLKMALHKRCITLIITSNGKLLKEHGQENAIIIPGGLPPRAALGYLFTPIPFILHRYHLMPNPYPAMIQMVNFLKSERKQIISRAKNLARWLYQSLPVIYSNSQAFHPVAYRWRCQFNENSKIFAHNHSLPEMNHNEIVGLGRTKNIWKLTRIVFLTDPSAHPRNLQRVVITKDLLSDAVS